VVVVNSGSYEMLKQVVAIYLKDDSLPYEKRIDKFCYSDYIIIRMIRMIKKRIINQEGIAIC